MYGPPKDVEGRCNARLRIGDDYSDNEATMLCQLDPGHEGPHLERYGTDPQEVVITWKVADDLPEDPYDDLDDDE
jgi:hypothetical protein